MAWLTKDANGILAAVYEPEGQAYYAGDNEVLHQFGDFYRAHGELPKITLKNFIADLNIGEYITA